MSLSLLYQVSVFSTEIDELDFPIQLEFEFPDDAAADLNALCDARRAADLASIDEVSQ